MRDGLVAIRDGEALTGYYKAANGGIYSIKNPNTREQYRCHVYARLNPAGEVVGLMEFPLLPTGAQTVNRFTGGGEGGQYQDIYLAKTHTLDSGEQVPAFRNAVESDILKARAATRENESKAAAKAKANDPMHRDERMANMLADAIRAASAPRDSGRAAR